MKVFKLCSIYAIAIGVLMLGMWLFFLIAGMVPEFENRPAEILMHLTAEFLTAASLITAGIILLRGLKGWKWLYPFSMGMLMYTLIVSPGYYLQSGDYVFVAMFAVFVVLTALFLGMYLKHSKEGFHES